MIATEYHRAPAAVNTVFLLGHVPVPYAGDFRPDGHREHLGAWPADVYYGAVDGAWTDLFVEQPVEGRQRNMPGDGKLDQSEIPGRVQLAVGRVDFFAMPAFGVDETTLLRRYLDRDHAYRQARWNVADRGLIQDGFPGHDERFAYSTTTTRCGRWDGNCPQRAVTTTPARACSPNRERQQAPAEEMLAPVDGDRHRWS